MKLLLLIFLLAPASLAFLAPLAAFRSPHALQSSTDAPESPSPATPEAPTTESPAPKLKMRKRAAKIVAVDSSPLRGSDSDAVEEVAVVFEGTTYAITSNFEGNGGFFIEVEVNNKGAGSRHTIIVAKEWQGELEEKAGRGTDPETIAKYVLHFFLQKKFKITNTEGMIDAMQFPINYFSARQVNYFYDDYEEILVGYIKEQLVV